MKNKKSDFGKGFIYNLILFTKHINYNEDLSENEKEIDKIAKKSSAYSYWFNSASDHLYELEIPKRWEDKKVGKLAKELRDLALEIGHGIRMFENSPKTEKDYQKVVKLTKEIGFEIDKELGLKPIKARFQ